MLDALIIAMAIFQFAVDVAMIAFAVYLYRSAGPKIARELFAHPTSDMHNPAKVIADWTRERDKCPPGSPRREAYEKRLKELGADND